MELCCSENPYGGVPMRKRLSKLFVMLMAMVMLTGNCLTPVAADVLFLDTDGDGAYDDVIYTPNDTSLSGMEMPASEADPDDPDPDPDPPVPVPAPINRIKLPTPNAVFSAVNMTLSNLDDSMCYSYDSGRSWTTVPDGETIIAVMDDQAGYALAHGISVIRFGDGEYYDDSDCQVIEVHKVPTPNGVTGVNPTSGNNGQIVNVSPGMQYRTSSSGWLDIGSNVIGGLSAGTYQVRAKAGGTAIASDPVNVTLVNATPTPTPTPPKERTPSADFNAMIGVLTGTQGNCYSIDGGSSWTNAGNANKVNLDMSRLSPSRGIKLYRPGNRGTTSDSDIQTIELKKASAPYTISAISATSTTPGMITGVTSAMEYMKQGAPSWTPVTGSSIAVLPGNYFVRISGAYTTLPSDAVAVTITQSITSAPVAVQPQKTNTTNPTTGITGKKLVVMQVQTALNALGYKAGTPDGLMGKRTRAAIRSYQKAHGLKVTGTINTSLVNSLHIK